MPESFVYILSGPVQTGKTSSLLQWVAGRNEMNGILTPVVNGKRVFREISTGEEYKMEAGPGESETLEIGRFLFSKKNFERAIQHIQLVMHEKGWLILDEIGPLELKDQGFHFILNNVLEQRNGKLLLVVREGMVNAVKEKYRLDLAAVIGTGTLPAIH